MCTLPGAMENPFHIHFVDRIKIFGGCITGSSDMGDARIIDQDIQVFTSGGRINFLCHRFGVVLVLVSPDRHLWLLMPFEFWFGLL